MKWTARISGRRSIHFIRDPLNEEADYVQSMEGQLIRSRAAVCAGITINELAAYYCQPAEPAFRILVRQRVHCGAERTQVQPAAARGSLIPADSSQSLVSTDVT